MGGAKAYTLQVRRAGEVNWTTASESIPLAGARKKNLKVGEPYAFRVKPTHQDGLVNYAFSRASAWLSVATVSPAIEALFGKTLVNVKGERIPISALAGKVIGVLASSSW